MINPSRLQPIFLGYAAILIATGIVAFTLSNGSRPTALLGGIGGGLLVIVLSFFYRRHALWSGPTLLTTVGIFLLSFLWRTIEAWRSGNVESAAVLAILALVTIPVFVVLIWTWKR